MVKIEDAALSLPPICFQTEHHWFNKNMIQEQQIEMDVFPQFYYLCHLQCRETFFHNLYKPQLHFISVHYSPWIPLSAFRQCTFHPIVIHSTHHTSKPNQSFATLALFLLRLIMVATSDYINLTWLSLRNSQLFCCVFSYHCYL